MYSSYFNGWIGKMDEWWIKENRNILFSSLSTYFHKHISSGQKLFIGFDHHQSSKYMATVASEFFSQNGIPVFIANRPLSTSMLQSISKERYGCGTLSFVRDDYSFPYIGMKASNLDGEYIKKAQLNVGDLKKQKKQPIDWFDPLLNLKNYIGTHFDFPDIDKASNSLLWNSMHSPLSPILEELFIDIFNKKSIDAYTINSYEDTLTKNVITEIDIQEQIDQTSLKMNEFLCHYGVTTSPDLSKFDVLVEKKGKITPIPFEEIISKIRPYIRSKEPIIISDEIMFSKILCTSLEFKKVPDKNFSSFIKKEPFSIAVDGEYNIYLQGELFPNHFAVLFCLYHSLIYTKDTKTSTNISTTNKVVEPTNL